MLTRCPSCATTFRITPEQLKARQGRVRCGQCQDVFNALETLIEEAAQAAAVVAAEASATEPPAIAPDITSAPEPAPLAPVAVPPGPTFSAGPDTAASIQEPDPPTTTTQAVETSGPETLVDYEPAFDTFTAEEPPRRAWPWVLGALLALLALALQATHHYRVELAVLLPEAKPALLAACEIAGCDLPLPRKADLVAIESSDLHPDPANAAQLQLVATLRNRAPFAQEYPHLELTLTDTADKALLRRVLAPADYLPKPANAKSAAPGFAANSDLALALTLEVKDLAPVGYRLYVFYP
ncbi:MAG: DUF3426 domain-containing protein [Sulfurisoma sp.]|nr:DUF3426 domain-containing protein [Sulfurisoma sp.]